MLFLSEKEKKQWKEMSEEIISSQKGPDEFQGNIRSNFIPVFQYYVGTLFTADANAEKGLEWLRAGTMNEETGLFSNAFLIGFLSRRKEFKPPEVCFADPAPFIHFANVPIMKKSRENFIKHSVDSLPAFKKPFRIMDIGCGDGALVAWLIKSLRDAGKVNDIGEILLIDSSPGMLEMAKNTVIKDFPSCSVKTINSRIEDVSDKINEKYDVALSSLAYHHIPLEKKKVHLENLKSIIDHFIIFELDANHDTPELYSPELALSIYQCYGRIIDFIFSFDSTVDIARRSVDCFLMTEVVSFLTKPRGLRSDYHMLKTQWDELFKEVLGKEFTCLCNSTAYGDEYVDLFTIHYGR